MAFVEWVKHGGVCARVWDGFTVRVLCTGEGSYLGKKGNYFGPGPVSLGIVFFLN